MNPRRRFLLELRLRAASIAFMCFGLAAVTPGIAKGFANFMLSPPGFGAIAIGLAMLGLSIEETGTIRRIRLGLGIRLGAYALVAAALVWSIARGALGAELLPLGFCLFAPGALGASVGIRHDFNAFLDVRNDQIVRLEKISAQSLLLRTDSGEISMPSSILRSAVLVKNSEGRGAVVLVQGRDKIRGDQTTLPWLGATLDGDTFILTEHQTGLDAEVLIQRLLEAAEAAQVAGYR